MPDTTAIVGSGFPAYSAGAVVALAAAATDFATIQGSATKKVTVTRILVGGVATAATSATISLIKRSTLDTGGTPVAMPGVLLDTSIIAEASKAVAQVYTANPGALGTAAAPSGGTLASVVVPLGTAAAPVPQTAVTAGVGGFVGIVLNGPAEQLCVNAGGATIAGASLNVTFEWQEQ